MSEDRLRESDLRIAVYSGVKMALDDLSRHSDPETRASRFLVAMGYGFASVRLPLYLCFAALCVIAWRVW